MQKKSSLPSLFTRTKCSLSMMDKSLIHPINNKKTNILERLSHEETKWFNKRGKSNSLIFDNEILKKLRKYFNDLDSDHSGAIGQQQLEDPLITLEFCQSKQQVKKLIEAIDLDGSGEIEFSEFLQIFRKIKLVNYKTASEAKKYGIFTKMFSNPSKNQSKRDFSYSLSISQIRRKKLISELKNNIPIIRPSQFRSIAKKQVQFNFLKRIESQFTQTPQISSVLKKNRLKDYYLVQLGKN